MVEEPVVQIEAGRHPIIDLLLGEGEQYVPNDTNLSVRLMEILPALFYMYYMPMHRTGIMRVQIVLSIAVFSVSLLLFLDAELRNACYDNYWTQHGWEKLLHQTGITTGVTRNVVTCPCSMQVALICIMAQIGSFVPARSATLGTLDAVYTR